MQYFNAQQQICKNSDKSLSTVAEAFPGVCLPVDDDFLSSQGYFAVVRPSITEFQQASFSNGAWTISDIDLSAAKTIQHNKINFNRDAAINAGFTYDGHLFDIDETAQNNMTSVKAMFLAGATNPHGGIWRSKDNVNVAMNDTEVQAFFEAAFTAKFTIYGESWQKKDAITAMTTVTDVAAADTSVG